MRTEHEQELMLVERTKQQEIDQVRYKLIAF